MELSQANALCIQGNEYLDQSDYEQALFAFSQALALEPALALALHNRALTFDALKEYDKALADFVEPFVRKADLRFLPRAAALRSRRFSVRIVFEAI